MSYSAEKDARSVRHIWRVVDGRGQEIGRWIERFNGNAAYDEAWALACAREYHPGREVQVQTITTSEWTRIIPPGGQHDLAE